METPEAGGRAGAPHRGRMTLIAAVGAGLALVVVIVTLGALAAHASAGRHGGGSGASARIAAATATATTAPPALNCNVTPAAPGCQFTPTPQATPAGVWVKLADGTPAAVLAAFRKSWRATAGDGQYDLSRPETPVMVREIQGHPTYDPISIWVIPFDTASGAIGVLASCAASYAQTAINCGVVEQLGTPRPHGQVARYTQAQALNIAQGSGVSLKSGARPYLIYAPIDYAAVATGKWNGGGAWDTPLWLVPGADGQDRVVADDGKVYLPAQLPLEPGS